MLEERVPATTARPRSGQRSRSDVDEELARLRRENAELKDSTSTRVLYSAILALVEENQRLARRHQRDDADVVPLVLTD